MNTLKLYRHRDQAGELYSNMGGFECYTLEPEPPVVPAGTYEVKLTASGRAAAGSLWTPVANYLPEVCEVPGHTGIRFHAGNFRIHTTGCILVGMQCDGPTLAFSRDALRHVISLLPATLIIIDP